MINSDIPLSENDKPILVVIHGFGSSAAQYYLCFEEFRPHFYMILIDNIGTGASDKPDDYLNSFSSDAKSSTHYTIEYIERWRQAMGLTDFFLLGHSYGGYMAGSYASKYHQHIKKLILMSPVGLRQPSDSRDYLALMEGKKRSPFYARGANVIVESAWKRKITPLSIYRCCGYKNTRRIIYNFKRVAYSDTETEEESRITANYLSLIFNRKPSTEFGLMTDFKPIM